MAHRVSVPLITPFIHPQTEVLHIGGPTPGKPSMIPQGGDLGTVMALCLRNAISNLKTQLERLHTDLNIVSQNVTLIDTKRALTEPQLEDVLRAELPAIVQSASDKLADHLDKIIAPIPSAVFTALSSLMPKIDEDIRLIRQRLDANNRDVHAAQTLQPLLTHLISLLTPIFTLATALPTLTTQLTEHTKLSTDLLSSLTGHSAGQTDCGNRLDEKTNALGTEMKDLIEANGKRDNERWEMTTAFIQGIKDGQVAEAEARCEHDERQAAETEKNDRRWNALMDSLERIRGQNEERFPVSAADEGVSVEASGRVLEVEESLTQTAVRSGSIAVPPEGFDAEARVADTHHLQTATPTISASAPITTPSAPASIFPRTSSPASSTCMHRLMNESPTSSQYRWGDVQPNESVQTDPGRPESQGSSWDVLNVIQQAAAKQDEENQQGATQPRSLLSPVQLQVGNGGGRDPISSTDHLASGAPSLKRKHSVTEQIQNEPSNKRRILLDPDEEDDEGESQFPS